ncbi:hypothetical protein PR202_gb18848 [Eleusine coracana subsp. coracana]|uniref:Leucine-rich repeat domain, L domain-like n=1 Tax=Eleusine coracana subsp. coracana TaxID=191504 RepID=A0AAV5F832_ELECO|nr:hypothetical protein PR202_gb18848 [Eleusine coracana subsp. coracana]
MSCFSFLLGGQQKRSKVIRSKVAYAKKAPGNDCPPKVMPVEFMDMADTVQDVSKGRGNSPPACNTNVFVQPAADVSAHRLRDVNEGKEASSNRDSSDDADLAVVVSQDSSGYSSGGNSKNNSVTVSAGESPIIGHMSPKKLKRSCSNIETARSVPVPEEFDDLPAKSRSYGDLKAALPSGRTMFFTTTPSPAACSADRVMLRRRSSSAQVLPSRSRKLWWRLFLWSHRNRNLHRRGSAAMPAALPSTDMHIAAQENEGYTSDTLDAVTAASREPKNKEVVVEEEEDPVLLPSQWVAFSSVDRVSAWVNSLQKNSSSFHVVDEDDDVVAEHVDGGAVRAVWCSEIEECSTVAAEKHHARATKRRVQASSVVQTVNVVSSVAHVSGMGLKAVPMIAAFSTLRAVNLSANFIAHIHPGSLPKGLHSLDLSRNKIASIEGLRELTRLRVLNLSYNRITRIGHARRTCVAPSDRMPDRNRMPCATDTSDGDIPRSTRNVFQPFISVTASHADDTLRRAVAGLLPRLQYLNKQPVKVKSQRAREAVMDCVVAQAALGNGGGPRSRPMMARRASQKSPGSSGKGKSHGSRSRSMTRTPARS